MKKKDNAEKTFHYLHFFTVVIFFPSLHWYGQALPGHGSSSSWVIHPLPPPRGANSGKGQSPKGTAIQTGATQQQQSDTEISVILKSMGNYKVHFFADVHLVFRWGGKLWVGIHSDAEEELCFTKLWPSININLYCRTFFPFPDIHNEESITDVWTVTWEGTLREPLNHTGMEREKSY